MYHNPKLVSTELSLLWTTYIQDSLAQYILKHFGLTTEDSELKPIITFALECSRQHLNEIVDIFTKENLPIPKAFSYEDLNSDAQKLFPDMHMYRYLNHMARGGLTNYAFGLSTSVRSDIRQLASKWLTHADKLYNLAIDAMLKKGILVRSPAMAYPTESEFVQKAHFFTDGFVDEDRPLLSVEIAHLGTNIEANLVVATTLLGFSQIASEPKLKNILYRGYQISKKHAEVFSSILRKEGVHAPSGWDSELTDSTATTFSDYLIVNNVASMMSIGISNYGTSVGASLRRDLGINYARLIAELGLYAEDLEELMIKHQWMEKPPQILNRKELTKDS
ncbi:DUF3231 family protein [Cytobacillus suaedae]|nr:DUF3231 family protein [Cytobacillus suaedae]